MEHKANIKLLLILVTLLCLTGCMAVETSTEPGIEEAGIVEQSNSPEAEADQLIVLAAPSYEYDGDEEYFQPLIDFDIAMIRAAAEHNRIILLVDESTKRFFKGKISDDILLEVPVESVWIRDFGTVLTESPVKFVYRPNYNEKSESAAVDKSFEQFAKSVGLSYDESDIVLDGGNFVGNEAGRAVLTERIFEDNPSYPKKKLVELIKQKTGLKEIAIIPEEEYDTTGHSDGMVMWASSSKLFVNKFPKELRAEVLSALQRAMPDIEIVEIPRYLPEDEDEEFSTAQGIYVNSLVTDNTIYMPTFDIPEDEKMLKLIQSHTDKKVIPVYAGDVADFGGTVRCLSLQLKGAMADKLLEYAKKH